MGDFPLPRIKDFIRTVVPFDTLDDGKLSRVVARMEIAYFPRGETIIRSGGPPAADLHIIKSGSVKVTLPDDSGGELLIDLRGEGDCFGALSLLQGSQALFDVTAREDLIASLLPAEHFKVLVAEQPSFKRHFSFSLARNIQASRRSPQRQGPVVMNGDSLGLDALLSRSLVSELMTTDVLTCAPATPVRVAARRMTNHRVGSIVVEEQSGLPLGILTDTDLRVRVLAGGMDPEAPVTDAMSQPVRTINTNSFAFEAMLEMIRHRVHHLVVTEGERVVGVISDHDLRVVTGAAPVGVVRDVDKIQSPDELELLHQKIDPVLEMLLRLGGSAEYMLDLVSEFNDRIIHKVLELTEMEMEHEGLGRAPVPYCWLALGSAGRREQALRTCQMNGLIFANLPAERLEGAQRWFLDLASRTVERLGHVGFPQCPDGLMANNPGWCQHEAAWQQGFSDLIQQRDLCVMPHSGPLFDFRGVHSEMDLAGPLRQRVGRAAEGNRQFLSRLARLGPVDRPPLGFLREFVVDKSGGYQEQLDLRSSGIIPLVRGTRVLALEQGLVETSTLGRLGELARLGILSERFASDLREAFGFITLLRVARHLEARAAGREADSFVVPVTLSKVQRKMLKDSFSLISELQDFLEQRYRAQMVA